MTLELLVTCLFESPSWHHQWRLPHTASLQCPSSTYHCVSVTVHIEVFNWKTFLRAIIMTPKRDDTKASKTQWLKKKNYNVKIDSMHNSLLCTMLFFHIFFKDIGRFHYFEHFFDIILHTLTTMWPVWVWPSVEEDKIQLKRTTSELWRLS